MVLKLSCNASRCLRQCCTSTPFAYGIPVVIPRRFFLTSPTELACVRPLQPSFFWELKSIIAMAGKGRLASSTPRPLIYTTRKHKHKSRWLETKAMLSSMRCTKRLWRKVLLRFLMWDLTHRNRICAIVERILLLARCVCIWLVTCKKLWEMWICTVFSTIVFPGGPHFGYEMSQIYPSLSSSLFMPTFRDLSHKSSLWGFLLYWKIHMYVKMTPVQ